MNLYYLTIAVIVLAVAQVLTILLILFGIEKSSRCANSSPKSEYTSLN